jgi:5'-3' exonuclease
MRNLIIDASILIHANYYVLSKYREVVETREIVNKVCSQISGISLSLSSTKIFLTLDLGGSFRKSIYSEYKGQRNHNFDSDAVSKQLSQIYNSYSYTGLESDDLVYLLAKSKKDNIIVSNDADLIMCTNDHTMYYNVREKSLSSYTEEQRQEMLIDKICFGCKSDNIPKIALCNRPVISKRVNFMKGEDLQYILKSLYLSKSITGDYKRNYELVAYDEEIYSKYNINHKLALL